MDKIYLDEEGYQNYLKEIEEIREKIRKNNVDISEFMSDDAYGDGWHDNFAYEQAIKKESSLLFELANKKKGLSKIEIITNKKCSNKVEIGSVVTIKIDDELEKYKLIGNTVSDLTQEIPNITLNSPLGKAIYNKKSGDFFSYSVDELVIDGKIISIK